MKDKLTGKDIKVPKYRYTGQKPHVVEQPKPTPQLGWSNPKKGESK